MESDLNALRNASLNLINLDLMWIIKNDLLELLILELLSDALLTQKLPLEKLPRMKLSLSSSLTSVTKTTMETLLWLNGLITTPLSHHPSSLMTTSVNSWNKHGAEQ